MNFILTTQNLTKTYGKKDAAKDINLHVREGEIYGLIGRNGAGKTTIMRMISGLSKPTRGTYTFHNTNNLGVGVLIESPGYYAKMTASENITLKCIALGCYSKEYVDGLLKLVGLADTGKKPVSSFSLGMRQRLGIALALVGNPKMIILDEPINGLDPQGIVEVRQILETLKKEHNITIMISSHILAELGKLADSYGIIHEGMLIDEFSVADLAQRCSQHVTLNTDDNARAISIIQSLGYQYAGFDNNGFVRIYNAINNSAEINKALVTNNIGVREIYIKNISLEDYYLSVTGGSNEQSY